MKPMRVRTTGADKQWCDSCLFGSVVDEEDSNFVITV